MATHGWASALLPLVLFLACLVSSSVSEEKHDTDAERCVKLMKVVRWCGERKNWKNALQKYMVKKLASKESSNMVRTCLTNALDPKQDSSYCEREESVKLFLLCSRIALFKNVIVAKKFAAIRFHNGYEHCVKLNMGIKMGTGQAVGMQLPDEDGGPDDLDKPDDYKPPTHRRRRRKRKENKGRPGTYDHKHGHKSVWANATRDRGSHGSSSQGKGTGGRMPGLPLKKPPTNNEHDNMFLSSGRRRLPDPSNDAEDDTPLRKKWRPHHRPGSPSKHGHHGIPQTMDDHSGVPDSAVNGEDELLADTYGHRRHRKAGRGTRKPKHHFHRRVPAPALEPDAEVHMDAEDREMFHKTVKRHHHHPGKHDRPNRASSGSGCHDIPASSSESDAEDMQSFEYIRPERAPPGNSYHGIPASALESGHQAAMDAEDREMFDETMKRHHHPAKHARPNRASPGNSNHGIPASALESDHKAAMDAEDREMFDETVKRHHHPAKHARPNRASPGSSYHGIPASALESDHEAAMDAEDREKTAEHHVHLLKHARPNRAMSGSNHHGMPASALESHDKAATESRDKKMFPKNVDRQHHPMKHINGKTSGISHRGAPASALGNNDQSSANREGKEMFVETANHGDPAAAADPAIDGVLHSKDTVVYDKSVSRDDRAALKHGKATHDVKPQASSLASNDEHSVEDSSPMRRRHPS